MSVDLVLVMVGTDFHPFPRLVEWTDDWFAARSGSGVRMVIQHGSTPAPRRAVGKPFLPRTELDDLLAESGMVVCHGGPSTIVETRRRGLVPIVLARSASLGEHVDNHQQRFARAMSDRGLVRLVDTRAAMHTLMDEAAEQPLLVAEEDQMANPAESAMRFGRLVEDLVAKRGPRRRSSPAA